MRGRSRWSLIALALVTASVAIVGVASAANENSDQTYWACLTNSGRLVNVDVGDEPRKPCSRRHKEVSWSSSQGPMGLPGPAGADGVDGVDGVDGTVGEIVMTESGTEWMVRSQVTPGLVEVVDRLAQSTEFSGEGWVVIGLTGPAAVGGTDYGLASFDLCLFGFNGGKVTEVAAIAIKSFGPGADDGTIYMEDVTVEDGSVDRTTGCHKYTVNTPVGQGVGLQVTIDGSVELFPVKSVWTPEAAQD